MLNKPILLITMGDPSGIGPEVILKALRSPDVYWRAIPVIFGDEKIFDLARKTMNIDFAWTTISSLSEIDGSKPGPFLLSLTDMSLEDFQWGKPKSEEGLVATFYLLKALEFVMNHQAQAIVTAPIFRTTLVNAGYPYPGQSELIASVSKTKYVARMMVGDNLKITIVTGHLPLGEVSKNLATENIFNAIKYTHKALQEGFGITNPKIAVCGLNPHGGDGKIMGEEEETIIRPAIAQARAEGAEVAGPFSTSESFLRCIHQEFTAAIAMYHDQGVTPFKLLYLDSGLTVTLGLSFVRTAPVHGPAFEIAGQGRADWHSMLGAIITAGNLASKKWGIW